MAKVFKPARVECEFARIVKVADKAYGRDGIVGECSRNGGKIGHDALAFFITRELRDTFDPSKDHEANLSEARLAMDLAIRQLRDVEGAMHREIVQIVNQYPLATKQGRKNARRVVDNRRQVR